MNNKGKSVSKKIISILLLGGMLFGALSGNIFAQAQKDDTIIIPKEGAPIRTGELVELNFQDIEVRSLLDIVSQFSGKSFLFKERDLKNRKITLISPEKYSIEEAYSIFEKILAVNDLRLIQEENNIIRVVNVNEAKRSLTGIEPNGDTGGFSNDIVVTRVIRVENTNINTVFQAINPFLSKKGTITRFNPTNSFIVKDTLENTKRIADLVKIFDTKTDYQVKTYTLKYIPITQFKPILERLINKETTTSRSQYFSYDSSKNRVVAVARKNEIKILEDLIKKLDISVKDSQRDGFLLKFVAVQHLKVNDVISLLQKVFGVSAPKKGGSIVIEGSIIVPQVDSNSFIIYGPITSIIKMERLIAEVDQEQENIFLEVIPIIYSDVKTVSKLVQQVFESRLVSASPLKLKITPETGTNSLIILGTEKTIQRVKAFVERFDRPQVASDAQGFKFYFYPIQNAKAANIASILSNLVGNITKQADAADPIVIGGDTKTSAKTKDDKTKKPATTKSTASSKSTTAENQLSIVADEETNSLIIYANQLQYNIIKSAIEDLDVVRPQVYVEALIVEVSLNKTLELGLNYSRAGVIGGRDSPTGAFNVISPGVGNIGPTTVAGAAAGLGAGAGTIAGAFGDVFNYEGVEYAGYTAFIRALATDREINILSNPKLITLNNKKASINVGENRAFPKDITTNSNGDTVQSFDYRDVGVKLEITPQINAGDYITMEITQENTASIFDRGDGTDTLKRTIQTEVVIKSGETIALGGLINDEKTVVENKIPCLGDIPFLGFLFKTQSTNSRKTNLVVFLTPTIIRNPAEQEAINQKALQQVKTPIKDVGKNVRIQLDNLYNDKNEEDTEDKDIEVEGIEDKEQIDIDSE